MNVTAIILYLDRVGVVPPAVVSRLPDPYRLVAEWWPFVPPAAFVHLPPAALWSYTWTITGGAYYLNADGAIHGIRNNIPVPLALVRQARDIHEEESWRRNAIYENVDLIATAERPMTQEDVNAARPKQPAPGDDVLLLNSGSPLIIDDFLAHLRAAIRQQQLYFQLYPDDGHEEGDAVTGLVVEASYTVKWPNAQRP